MSQLPVFVYGTLRRGQCNHRVVADALETVHEARLPGHCLYSAGLPYVAEGGEPGQQVAGDLLVIRAGEYDAALERLDQLEGFHPPHRSLYEREACAAVFRDQHGSPWQECRAWVYHGGSSFDFSPDLIVPGGDWLAGRPAA